MTTTEAPKTTARRAGACLSTLFALAVAVLILVTLSGLAVWAWRSAL